jgi:hypothetical protein
LSATGEGLAFQGVSAPKGRASAELSAVLLIPKPSATAESTGKESAVALLGSKGTAEGRNWALVEAGIFAKIRSLAC